MRSACLSTPISFCFKSYTTFTTTPCGPDMSAPRGIRIFECFLLSQRRNSISLHQTLRRLVCAAPLCVGTLVKNTNVGGEPSKVTTGYFTFFDIATKKILLNDYCSAKEVDGYGLTKYWGISIVGTTKNYAASFRKRLKQN
jgi:hypothetical protein